MTTSEVRQELKLDVVQLKKAALVFRAINHPLRRQMLELLHSNMQMTVTALYVKLRIEQSVASQHLAILRRAELVHTERNGKQIFYSVNYARVKEVHAHAFKLVS